MHKLQGRSANQTFNPSDTPLKSPASTKPFAPPQGHDEKNNLSEHGVTKIICDSVKANSRITRVLTIGQTKADCAATSALLQGLDNAAFSLDQIVGYEAAAVALAQGKHDVCVLDVGSDVNIGLAFLRAAIAAGCKTPIILWGDPGDPDYGLQAIRAGAADYLVKEQISSPLLERSILYAMERSVERHAAQLEHNKETQHDLQNFLQSTLDTLSAHIAVLDEGGQVIAVNKAWRSFAEQNNYGDPTYGVGSNYLSICRASLQGSSEARELGEGIARVIEGKSPQFESIYTCHSPETRRWFNLRATRFDIARPGESGSSENGANGAAAHKVETRVVIVHEDVSPSHLAEERRWQSEQRVTSLLQSAPIIMWVVDTDLVFTYSYGRGLEGLGLVPKDVIGKALPNLYRDYPEIIEGHERALSGEEVSLVARVGDLVFESHYAPLRDNEGSIIGVTGVALDVTARVGTEEALRESEARFRTVVQSLGEALLITDFDDHVLYANPRLTELTGYEFEEMIGRPAYELLLPPSDWPQMRARNGQRAKGRAECYELLICRKDNSTFWAEVNATPYRDSTGNIIGTMGALTDISGRKSAEERQKATTEGLLTVLASADELLACRDIDSLARQAVGMARDRLGIERCGIFLIDHQSGDEAMVGAYGTNSRGETTDEHSVRLSKTQWIEYWHEPQQQQGGRWAVHADRLLYEWSGDQAVIIGRGWAASTLIYSSQGVVGAFSNDAARTNSPLDETKQELLAVLCSLLGNIIERVRTEEALAEERNLLRTLIDNLPDHIYIKDRESRFILYNEALVRHFMLPSPDWLLGKSDADLFIEHDGPRDLPGGAHKQTRGFEDETAITHYRNDEVKLMQTGEPILNWEYPGVGPGGKPEWFLISKLPLRDSHGNITGLVGTNRYITQAKEAEERQRALTEGLRTVLDVADELLSTPSVDMLLRRAVELARARLGLERCAIFLFDYETVETTGTYGTDFQGQTTDEHHLRRPLAADDHSFLYLDNGNPTRWNLTEHTRLMEWDGNETVEVGQGWQVKIPIFSSRGPARLPVGFLVNDAVISGAPVDETRQEMAAVLCSLLGNMIERRRATEQLRESEEKYRTIIDTAYEGIWLLDAQGNTSYVNRQMGELLGYTTQEMQGRPIYDFMDEESQPDARQIFERHREGSREQYEFCLRRKDGSQMWAYVSTSSIYKRGGEFDGMLGMITDVTERKQAEDALRESEERYALAANGANDGLWDWDLRTDRVHYSSRWKEMLGHDDEEIGNSPQEWLERVHPDDAHKVSLEMQAHIEGHTPHFESEHRMMHSNEVYRWMLTRGLAVRDENGVAYRMAGSQTDITERKVSEEQLLYNAFRDSLTGLPNRALFKDRLTNALEHLKRRADHSFAVLFLDLDQFKVINDSLGHMVGDKLLTTVARRLESCLRPGDTVARLGGDEFTILLDDIENTEAATIIAQRIQEEVSKPINLDGHERYTTTSIGIALSATGYERPDDILRDADTAMYRAKGAGRARYEVFDKAMHIQAVTRLELESSLRSAMQSQLLLHYQPIVDMVSGRITGFEALVRWNHPTRGMVSPGEFIPLAEETGLILPISEWVLKEACRQMRAWQKEYQSFKDLTINVNLSSKQFSQPGLSGQVEDVLRESGLDAQHLKLEITESVIMQNAATVTTTLSELRALNVHLCMDDFGTGYSSLSYLHNFPIDVLKIDRSFVSRIGPRGENAEIVRTILNLADNLKLELVAEGIETREQMVQLQEMGCPFGQGYLFAKPLDHTAAAALVEDWTSRKSDFAAPATIPKVG